MKVLIAGGGIGGLTLGIALRRIGAEPLILERAPEFRPVGAGIILAINGLSVMKRLGILEDVVRAGAPLRQGVGRDAKGRVISRTPFDVLAQQLGAPAVAFHRAQLHDVLARSVGMEHVRLGVEVARYEQDSAGVSVHLTNGQTERAEVLVGADGLHSRVRAQMLGEAAPVYAGQTTWRGVARGVPGVEPGVASETWGPARRFGAVPLKDDRVYWFAVADAPVGGNDERPGVKAALLEAYRDWHAPIRAIIEATDEEAILRTDLFDRDPTPRWSDGRVTLLGDAAHPMTPNMGQGACQAIEDALVLASALSAEPDVGSAFARYESRRHARTEKIVTGSRKFGLVAHWRNPVARFLRDSAMRAIPESVVTRQLANVIVQPDLLDEQRTPLRRR